MSTPIIINPKAAVVNGATVDTSADGTVRVCNPDGEVCASGFPSEDAAHWWLEGVKSYRHLMHHKE